MNKKQEQFFKLHDEILGNHILNGHEAFLKQDEQGINAVHNEKEAVNALICNLKIYLDLLGDKAI